MTTFRHQLGSDGEFLSVSALHFQHCFMVFLRIQENHEKPCFSCILLFFMEKSRSRLSAEGLGGLVCREKIYLYMPSGRFEHAEAVAELKRQLFGTSWGPMASFSVSRPCIFRYVFMVFLKIQENHEKPGFSCILLFLWKIRGLACQQTVSGVSSVEKKYICTCHQAVLSALKLFPSSSHNFSAPVGVRW